MGSTGFEPRRAQECVGVRFLCSLPVPGAKSSGGRCNWRKRAWWQATGFEYRVPRKRSRSTRIFSANYGSRRLGGPSGRLLPCFTRKRETFDSSGSRQHAFASFGCLHLPPRSERTALCTARERVQLLLVALRERCLDGVKPVCEISSYPRTRSVRVHVAYVRQSYGRSWQTV